MSSSLVWPARRPRSPLALLPGFHPRCASEGRRTPVAGSSSVLPERRGWHSGACRAQRRTAHTAVVSALSAVQVVTIGAGSGIAPRSRQRRCRSPGATGLVHERPHGTVDTKPIDAERGAEARAWNSAWLPARIMAITCESGRASRVRAASADVARGAEKRSAPSARTSGSRRARWPQHPECRHGLEATCGVRRMTVDARPSSWVWASATRVSS